MVADSWSGVAPRPPSEFEWEDLLYRLEIMPRVLAVTLERSGYDSAVTSILVDLVRRESWVADLLGTVAGGVASAEAEGASTWLSVTDARDSFARRRARNFAIVQRRGIEVWDWELRPEDESIVTPYQLLTFLASEDVRTLAAIRAASNAEPATC